MAGSAKPTNPAIDVDSRSSLLKNTEQVYPMSPQARTLTKPSPGQDDFRIFSDFFTWPGKKR